MPFDRFNKEKLNKHRVAVYYLLTDDAMLVRVNFDRG